MSERIPVKVGDHLHNKPNRIGYVTFVTDTHFELVTAETGQIERVALANFTAGRTAWLLISADTAE